MEESPPSETTPVGTSVVVDNEVAAPVINHSSDGILLYTLVPHLTELLPLPTAPQPSPVMPSTTVTTAPSLSLACSDDLMEDFL